MPINLKSLRPTLLNSGLQQKHPSLYQVINNMLGFAQDNIDNLNIRVLKVENGGTGGVLTPSGVIAGTYGNATNVGQFTVDINGVITFAANVPIIGGSSGFAHQFLMGA